MNKNWERYLTSQKYNDALDIPTSTRYETNWNMYLGNQWPNLNNEDLPKPVFNIIKRIITFFVASLTATDIVAKWKPLAMRDNNEVDQVAAEILTNQFAYFVERTHLKDKIIEVLTDGAVTGDMCYHLYLNDKKPYNGVLSEHVKGEICIDVIEGKRVHFGDPNCREVEKQPYIQIEARETVKSVKAEYKTMREEGVEDITSDSVFSTGYDGELELDGKENEKVTVIYTYEMIGDTVRASKDTENVSIYSDIDTGLTRYPVAWQNWLIKKNQYHGGDVVSEVISNQIFINRAFAMAMYSVLQTAFPKLVYNADKMTRPTNKVGESIGVSGLTPGDRISDIMQYADTGDMSHQVERLIDQAWKYTKEVMGINDVALGTIDPKRTSGVAITAIQKQTEVPLGVPKANLYKLVEDVANIYADMTSAYYGKRPVVINDKIQEYDFELLKQALIKNQIDVGASSYWSEIAGIQTLDSLFMADKISAVEYFERMPNSAIPNIEGLVKARKQEQAEQEQLMAFFESLPDDVKAKIQAMPEEQQEQVIRDLMNTQQLAS